MGENLDELFKVSNMNLDAKEIMREIESRIRIRSIDKEELEKILKQKIHSDINSIGFRAFDPAYTANLYEKGISPPKFTNPKLWFIKGPIKWFVVKLIQGYGFLDQKLSRNKVKAFYSVLHELIALRRKVEELEKEIQDLKHSKQK